MQSLQHPVILLILLFYYQHLKLLLVLIRELELFGMRAELMQERLPRIDIQYQRIQPAPGRLVIMDGTEVAVQEYAVPMDVLKLEVAALIIKKISDTQPGDPLHVLFGEGHLRAVTAFLAVVLQAWVCQYTISYFVNRTPRCPW